MAFLNRQIEATLLKYLKLFPVVSLTGPRQTGKTTILTTILKKYTYVNFDDLATLSYFLKDPHGFCAKYNNKVIFDEIQKAPEMFHYLKLMVDQDRQNYGKFVISGSSQFKVMRHISESLAGRAGNLSLLPFQYYETPTKQKKQHLLHGGYPELINRNYKGSYEWYDSYVQNYLEKDIRGVFNIGNLRDFHSFITLLASHVAQELNMAVLSRDLGVSLPTIKQWISVLEASYIVFLIPPFFDNFGKRLTKRPKIFFYDTGLICHLTGIRTKETLDNGPLAGQIFENYIVAEYVKAVAHLKLDQNLFYLRTNTGLEIDLVSQNHQNQTINLIEIKKSHTFRPEMFKNIKILQKIGLSKILKQYRLTGNLIYQGDSWPKNSDQNVFNYEDFLMNNSSL